MACPFGQSELAAPPGRRSSIQRPEPPAAEALPETLRKTPSKPSGRTSRKPFQKTPSQPPSKTPSRKLSEAPSRKTLFETTFENPLRNQTPPEDPFDSQPATSLAETLSRTTFGM